MFAHNTDTSKSGQEKKHMFFDNRAFIEYCSTWTFLNIK